VTRGIGEVLPRPPRAVVRRDGGTWTLQSVLQRKGLGPVAGVDEAGRGACAGPLVIAACVLRPADADELGVHVANLEGMRRTVAGLAVHPGYVLTDGFPVPGLTAPNMAVIGGDRAAACVSAASVLAKVTRDRIMVDLHAVMPWYGFGEHKGYCTPEHNASLLAHGPCTEHRFSYVNVVLAARAHGLTVPPRRRTSLLPAEFGPEWRTADYVAARAGGASTR
jgi:ribonuclease HII